MKHSCATCPTRKDCIRAFGKYWPYKSHNGKGCDNPFSYAKPVKAVPPVPTRKRIYTQGTFR